MRGRAWGVGLAVLAAATATREAQAQNPPAAAQPAQPVPSAAATPPAPDAMPPDVVKLKNGSMYRGTVMELVAGDHVDVRLPSGETKRFPMSDVDYAGAAASAPGATPPPPLPPPPAPPPPAPAEAGPRPLVTIDAKLAKIHFESDSNDTDLHIRTQDVAMEGTGWGWGRGFYGFATTGDAKGYARICASPCDATLPVGKYRLALSQEGKRPVEPQEAIEIPGPAIVHGTYVSRAGTRAGGWVLFATSLLVGTGLVIAGAADTSQNCTSSGGFGGSPDTFCTPQANAGLITAGTAVAVIGSLVSLAFILQHDRADISVEPQ